MSTPDDLQEAWDSIASLPPIVFSENEAYDLIARLCRTERKCVEFDMVEARGTWVDLPINPDGPEAAAFMAALIRKDGGQSVTRLLELARVLCDNHDARLIADQVDAPCYDASEPHVQAYWRIIAAAALAQVGTRRMAETAGLGSEGPSDAVAEGHAPNPFADTQTPTEQTP